MTAAWELSAELVETKLVELFGCLIGSFGEETVGSNVAVLDKVGSTVGSSEIVGSIVGISDDSKVGI